MHTILLIDSEVVTLCSRPRFIFFGLALIGSAEPVRPILTSAYLKTFGIFFLKQPPPRQQTYHPSCKVVKPWGLELS